MSAWILAVILKNSQSGISTKADKDKSIIVVADTHFGLCTKSEVSDPNAFADFLDWIKDLEKDNKKELKIGDWASSATEKSLTFEPPEKIILLGDILELWTASNEAVFASTMHIIQLLSKLKCEKIYVLGNHDYDLFLSLTREGGNKISYPLGTSDIRIIEKEYWISKGEANYYFIHGQQFDKLFALPSWKFMAPIRKAALAFGDYAWILVALCLANFILQTIVGAWRVTDIVLTLFLTVVSLPYWFLILSRKVWNYMKTIKWKPHVVEKEYEERHKSLWEILKEKSEIFNVVYGHTHTIDNWVKDQFYETADGFERTFMEVFNIPSWIEHIPDEKKPIKNEISHIFLYITESGSRFIGWDHVRKKPYWIPKELVIEKRKRGNLSEFKNQYYRVLINHENIEQKLAEIDWPDELIKKWMTGF